MPHLFSLNILVSSVRILLQVVNNASFLQISNKSKIVHNYNGKPNPDDVVLYLHTTFERNSFDTISITSCPMTLVNPREFHDV